MIDFRRELYRYKVDLLLRVVVEARGNQCATARRTGLHRNTVRRLLRGAGYDAACIKRLVALQRAHGPRKPVTGVTAAGAKEWRVA